ncbi:Glucoamylase P [Verticillium dahliae VDG1]|nr:Glucoamylase P [Verticillium dahliae VDG1]
MKRKIDQTEEPEVAATPMKKPSETKATWDNLGLSPRLLQGVAQLNWHNPTDIQAKAVPLALEGRDILAKSGTGTGKTAAYVLPVLEKVLQRKEKEAKGAAAATSVLMLVPTRELADQVHRSIESLAAFCAKDIQAVKLTDKVSTTVQRALLSANPDIVISTPARAWDNVSSSALSLANLTHLVLDEADLVLSYGYKEDLQNVARSLPKGVQTILMSATLTPEVDTVKGLFCRNPALLDLEQPEAEGDGITQFVVKCAEDEKFLLIYVIFKLKLIQGKALVFCHDVDRSYKLKLYFEQFGIRSCILNAELPVNSRLHVVDEFNKGVYDILIASDDNEVEYGVSRGVDFKNVAAVINFDLPTSAKSYTHRIGRTARAGQRGMALSFVIPAQHYRGHPPSSVESAEHDEKILARIEKQQAKKGKEVKPYHFDMAQVSAFKYRMDDALRAVTRVAVREARTRELRQELIKSDKLRRHFEENPQELAHLRHDGELRAARMQPHLRHVPDYLLPADGKKGLTADEVGFVPLRKKNDRRNSSRRAGGKKNSNRVFKVGRKKSDPLKSFKAKAAKK